MAVPDPRALSLTDPEYCPVRFWPLPCCHAGVCCAGAGPALKAMRPNAKSAAIQRGKYFTGGSSYESKARLPRLVDLRACLPGAFLRARQTGAAALHREGALSA